MKHEWKKDEKELYNAKRTPALITIPPQKFIMISGKGNPNDPDFSERVSALYSLAYAIKTRYKASPTSSETDDFTVYPLEGIWKQKAEAELIKENLEYTIMIRQPDFITKEMVSAALDQVKQKKPHPLYPEIRFDTMEDGICIEILHTGSYNDEPASFEKMDIFSKASGLTRTKNHHREIYLNNATRTEKSKLKTILRYCVK